MSNTSEMKKITIVDIAKGLGISASTVSRALNGIGRMNADTRQQIIELAKELSYHPNPHAQRLQKVKSSTIGVIIPELTHHFFSQIVKGVDEILDHHGYQQIICVTNDSYEKEKSAAETLLNARVDGLLVALSNETKDYDHIQQFIDEEVPVVFLDRMCEDILSPYVMTDDFEGALKATEYLISSGCKNIAFAKGPKNISTTFSRFMGFKEALKKHNIPINNQLILEHENRNNLQIRLYQLFSEFSLDGLLAHSDYHAFRALEIINKMGYSIPKDIQIIGYADEPLASYTTPKITTVKQPAFEIGKVGMELLLYQIDTGEMGDPRILETELIIRDSTK